MQVYIIFCKRGDIARLLIDHGADVQALEEVRRFLTKIH